MKIKHHELTISEEQPFENCKLNREPYARILTDIVSICDDGFVLALNNDWGTGKTTFVKMWQQLLKNEGFQTIYFNAWENDFDSNPLVALMSELETLINEKNKNFYQAVLEKGAVLFKHVAPALVKSILNRNGIDLNQITEGTLNASTELLVAEINAYTSKKKTLIEFRKELESFVKQSESSKPLIFIIDELDRCRPNYSVEVLEQIKHFFSVPGIVFVLSIDKNHLGNAIKGFYGSEHIDTNEYLRRFIDLEYSIPAPTNKDFCKYLLDYYEMHLFFNSPERRSKDDKYGFLKMSEMLFNRKNTTLRQQEKTFGLTTLILRTVDPKQNIHPEVFFFLIYLKVLENNLFLKIQRKELSVQELSNEYEKLVYSDVRDPNGPNITYIHALLLWFYNNSFDRNKRISLSANESDSDFVLPIKSSIENGGTDYLLRCFDDITQKESLEYFSLDLLLKNINLMEPIIPENNQVSNTGDKS